MTAGGGVVHVLKHIHRWLRPDGVLLDLHPEPEQPVVEAIVGGSHIYLVDPAIVARARELLSAPMSCELRVSERVLATRLQRVERPVSENITVTGPD